MGDRQITYKLNDKRIEQIKQLMKDCAKEVNAANAKTTVGENIDKKNELIDVARPLQLIDDIYNGDINHKARIYSILKDEETIGFEIAVIKEVPEKKRIIGFKPWLYVKPEHRGEETREIDNHIEEWFKTENVTHEVIKTGINMRKNILTYISNGFVICKKSDKNVVFVKDMNNPISSEIRRKLKKDIRAGRIEAYKDGIIPRCVIQPEER